MLKITFNGVAHELAEKSSVADFLQANGIDVGKVIVEWNEDIVSGAKQLRETALSDGDVLNAFSIVAGG